MTTSISTFGGHIALYVDRDGYWRTALNALGQPIICETRALALSVAGYRRRRMERWT